MDAAVRVLGDFVAGFDPGDIPAPVVDAAALHALDTLGCGLAASALGEVAWVTGSLDDAALGRSTAIGVSHRLAAPDAALVNGTLCHALDFDDTHPAAIVHASAVVVPTALAVGESLGRSGADVLAAIVVGCEVATRLGMAAGTAFHSRGMHSTGICGVFGAAAASARLRRLDADEAAHALGLAASMASGTLEFLADGAQTKPLHAGWAAHGGVLAARFAANGACAPATALEGARGLFASYLHGSDCDVHAHIADLGHQWETPNLTFKLHPVCHYIHAALGAFARLQRHDALAADDIASIVVIADEITTALVLEPLAAKRAPKTPYDAKFSIPWCLATQLVTGRVDVESFSADALHDPRIRRVAELVSYEVRPSGGTPNSFSGAVRVTRTDGTQLHADGHAPGHPDNPVSTHDVLSKYRANARLALPEPSVLRLEAGIRSLHFDGGLESLGCMREARAGGRRERPIGAEPALT